MKNPSFINLIKITVLLSCILPYALYGQNTVITSVPASYTGANYLTKWQNNTAFPRPTFTVDGSQNLTSYYEEPLSRNHYVQLRVTDLGSMTVKVLNQRFRIKAFVDAYFQTTPAADTIKNIELTIDHRPQTNTTFRESDVYKIIAPATSGSNIVYINLKSIQIYKWINATDSVLITSVNDADFVNPANNYLSWRLEAWTELERYTKLDQTVAFDASNITPDYLDVNPITTDNLVVSWTPITGAQEYELELTHIDDYKADAAGNITNIPAAQLKYDFTRNSTRIRVNATATSYTIPIVYERGFLLVRVRGVGRNPQDLSKPYFTKWSEPANTGLVSTFTQRYRIASIVHEGDKLNWQMVSNFYEEGKRSDVITYFDGMMRNRQSSSKSYTYSTMVVNEQLYDYEGRPAVQLLPTPISDTKIRFYPNLNGLTPYNKANFEYYNSASCSIEPQAMTSTPGYIQGAAQYYSPTSFEYDGELNTFPEPSNAYIPQAFNYPFTQVEYTKDNTGRVKRQGGLGRDHRLGSGHETKYYYGVPSQIELDRLFGNEAGDAIHYKKNMVIDANGQASISYHDLRGNVIASALAGNAPANLDTLNPRAVTVIDSLLDFTTVDSINHALVVQKTFLVPAPTSYTFSYQITPEKITFNNCQNTAICFDCIYDFSVKLTRDDICGDCSNSSLSTVWSNAQTIGQLYVSGGVDLACGTPVNTTVNSGALNLSPGSYTLTKTLKVNDAALDAYVNAYISTYTTSCAVWATLKANEEAKMDTLSCNLACGCTTELAAYQAAPNDSLKLYDLINCAQSATCSNYNTTPNACEIAYQTMLDDVSLGGQYMEYSTAYDTTVSSTQYLMYQYAGHIPLTFLNNTTTNKFPNIVINGSVSARRDWQHPGLVYKDEFNNTISVDVNGTLKSVNQLTLAEFIEYYQPIWANTLVKLHPEYCQWEWCNTTAKSGYDHIRDISKTTTYATAGTFLNVPTSDLTFYTGTRWTDLITAVKKYYEYPAGSNTYPFNSGATRIFSTTANTADADFIKTLLQRAAAVTIIIKENLGACNITNATTFNTCYNIATFGNTGLSTAIKNKQWEVFRDFYLSLKNEVLYKEGVTTSRANNCYNGCIGVDPFQYSQNNFTNEYNTQSAEPCYNLTAALFKTKRKAFPSINDEPSLNQDNINLYTATNPLTLLNTGGAAYINVWDNITVYCDTSGVGNFSHPVITLADAYLGNELKSSLIPCLNLVDTLQGVSLNAPYDPVLIIQPQVVQGCDPCQQTTSTSVPIFNPCGALMYAIAAKNAELRYQYFKDSLISVARNFYYAKCMRALEKFSATYQDKLYHFTLYYYDQANNLVKTIPPNGIDYALFSSSSGPVTTLNNIRAYRRNNHFPKILGGNNTPVAYYPPHKYPTYYQYNSLNQVTYQWSPDAGGTRMIYDEMRRLVRSHNANQRRKKFSYTFYDYLNRVVETGESAYTIDQDTTITSTTYAAHLVFVSGGTKSQITRTRYDVSYSATIDAYFSAAAGQENLRGRIASVMYSPTNGTANGLPTFEQATHYSYDIHGNVKTLIQDHATFGRKRIDYTYELISGNVRTVWYQKGRWDQFIHYYSYDADNRLKWVQTSQIPTAVVPAVSGMREQEAQYFYYRYGPLRRTELGTLRVQGLDYAYTIQGWIKGVNGGVLTNTSYDIGKDGKIGNINVSVARDAFGYVLGYYSNAGQNDYHPIGNAANAPLFDPTGYTVLSPQSLYNGNIPQMITTTREPGSTGTVFRSHRNIYQYDQLHRLKTQRAWEWNGTSFGTTPYSGYFMSLKYDYAGNITSLRRDGDPTTGLSMDKLRYNYAAGKPNRLTSIYDTITTTAGYLDDIETQAANNYSYDNIGNLIGDLSESGKTVAWNVYNKITGVSLNGGATTLSFGYDAAGNRVRKEKEITASGTITKQWYVRDAQGNVLSVYNQTGTGTLKQNVVYLYGSTRLGEYLLNRDSSVTWNRHHYRVKGNRHYELSNHLGNVLAVVTDRKMAQDTTVNTTYNPQYFLPDIYSVQNYYAFGQNMTKWSTSTLNDPTRYRYGFNGKEDDDEWGKQDYGFRIHDPRIGRFLSVDPLAKQYPMLTTYQFASNTPIQAIDLDGLEMYYAAYGAYLGKSGTSTEIRIVADHTIWENAKKNLKDPNNDHTWLINRSIKVHRKSQEIEDKIMVSWAPKLINYTYEHDGREAGISIFTKTLTNENGESFDVIAEGSVAKGRNNQGLGGGEVEIENSTLRPEGIDLEQYYGWKRSTSMHSHPGHGESQLSNEYGTLDKYRGDIYSGIKRNIKILMVSDGYGFIKSFDPAIYNKVNPKGMYESSREEHEAAIDKATKHKYLQITPQK